MNFNQNEYKYKTNFYLANAVPTILHNVYCLTFISIVKDVHASYRRTIYNRRGCVSFQVVNKRSKANKEHPPSNSSATTLKHIDRSISVQASLTLI